jgi:hypothetical protein
MMRSKIVIIYRINKLLIKLTINEIGEPYL